MKYIYEYRRHCDSDFEDAIYLKLIDLAYFLE